MSYTGDKRNCTRMISTKFNPNLVDLLDETVKADMDLDSRSEFI